MADVPARAPTTTLRPADVLALTPCNLLFMSAEGFRNVMKTEPKLASPVFVHAGPQHGRAHGGRKPEAEEQGQLQVPPALAECRTQNKPPLRQRDR